MRVKSNDEPYFQLIKFFFDFGRRSVPFPLQANLKQYKKVINIDIIMTLQIYFTRIVKLYGNKSIIGNSK